MCEAIFKQIKEKLITSDNVEIIDQYEQIISDNIEELSNDKSFFEIPLNLLFRVISKVDFSLNTENIMNIIESIIKNTIQCHNNEDETLLLLKYLKTKNCSLSFEDIIHILKNFTNSELLVQLNEIHEQNSHDVEIDYDYELKQKDKEIKRLKKFDVPEDFIPDIFAACTAGNLPSVKHIIENQDISPGSENWDGDPLILIAANYGHLDIIKYLIETHNISPNTRGSGGLSPLHIACQRGYAKIVNYLLPKSDIECRSQDGMTPLLFACEYGFKHIVQVLLFNGANKEASDDQGRTALFIACQKGYLEIASDLVTIFQVNINTKDHDNWTPLHIAVSRKHNQIIKLLVSHGADKTIQNSFGLTPAELANDNETRQCLSN